MSIKRHFWHTKSQCAAILIEMKPQTKTNKKKTAITNYVCVLNLLNLKQPLTRQADKQTKKQCLPLKSAVIF